jgi:hypothetical protein
VIQYRIFIYFYFINEFTIQLFIITEIIIDSLKFFDSMINKKFEIIEIFIKIDYRLQYKIISKTNIFSALFAL